LRILQRPAQAAVLRRHDGQLFFRRWIIPLHFDLLDGELHRRRFARLYGMEDWGG